jgi:hypothetical protein
VARLLLALLLLAAPLSAAEQAVGTIRPEISLTSLLPGSGAADSSLRVFGAADGHLCALALEGFRLRATVSADGGRTFEPDVDVAGTPLSNDVVFYEATRSVDGRIHVILGQAGPASGVGLAATRSDDGCRSWTPPVSILDGGPPRYGVEVAVYDRPLRIEAGSNGFVAVTFQTEGRPGGTLLSTSRDAGETWSAPVRVDTPPTTAFQLEHHLAVDPATNRLIVAYVQARPEFDDYFRIWTRRSDDLGQTLEPERPVAFASYQDYYFVDIRFLSDGSVLISRILYDWNYGFVGPAVARSENGGETWSWFTGHGVLSGADWDNPPRIVTASGGVVLLPYAAYDGMLRVLRSTDYGKRWAEFDEILTTTARTGAPFDTQRSLLRMPSGTLIAAWQDRGGVPSRPTPGIYVRSSTDDGATWSAEVRASELSNGRSFAFEPRLAIAGSTELALLYLDGRLAQGRSEDIFLNRSTEAALEFSADARVDSDASSTPVRTGSDPTIASDSAEAVHVAFTSTNPLGAPAAMVATSRDRGRSFDPIAIVDDDLPGAKRRPVLAAPGAGQVYLAYLHETDQASPDRFEIRFARSEDYGASWQVSPAPLGTTTDDLPPALAASATGRVYVGWGQGSEPRVARSADSGQSFVVAPVGSSVTNGNPLRLCAQGARVVAMWKAQRSPTESSYTLFAATSDDGGASYSTPLDLATPATISYSLHTGPYALACEPGARVLAAWRESATLVRARLFDGIAWAPLVAVANPGNVSAGSWNVQPSFTDAGRGPAVVVYMTSNGVYSSWSVDGGPFPSYQRLDNVAPRPDAASLWPRVATDYQGNVWVTWIDYGAGTYPSMLVRRSVDGGSSWGGLRRLDTTDPQGAYENFFSDGPTAAALPGLGVFTWYGWRNGPFNETLFQTDPIPARNRHRDGHGRDRAHP